LTAIIMMNTASPPCEHQAVASAKIGISMEQFEPGHD
jgi:hypothetical protein